MARSFIKKLIDNVIAANPKLSIDIIRRMEKFNIDDDKYKSSKVNDILQENPSSGEQIIKSVEDWDISNKYRILWEIVHIHPELFPIAQKVADEKTFLIHAVIDAKDKLFEKDINMIMGKFSLKNFRKLYSEDMAKGLDFIEKVAKGNSENIEIQKKCLLLLQIYNSDNKAKGITDEILAMQPKLKEDCADKKAIWSDN